MIDDTLRRLEERIRASERTGDGTRRELLELVGQLRSELAGAVPSDDAGGASLARHAEAAAAGEAPQGAAAEIEDALRGFEGRHPKVVAAVRALMVTLGEAGI